MGCSNYQKLMGGGVISVVKIMDDGGKCILMSAIFHFF